MGMLLGMLLALWLGLALLLYGQLDQHNPLKQLLHRLKPLGILPRELVNILGWVQLNHWLN